MPIVIFDTNVYRNLARAFRGISIQQRKLQLISLFNKELSHQHSKELNFWVICELIKNLEDSNKDNRDCELALSIALEHCTHMGKLMVSPPIQIDIAEHYNLNNIKQHYLKVYTDLINVCYEYISNGKNNIANSYIASAGSYIEDTKQQMINGYTAAKEDLKLNWSFTRAN
ncbi:hypothetical protein GCM10027275_00800 [Rhabdobacter roseus]|uniref:Uncharacterized protein n=1 Tax=Rhabdobacter roseus TaxID=1655419 RepID=A0A840TEN8_9BACT|nr:hypothetical protein [Rhabdobacter roseus]MBB5281964.1 hypothetical protein [Rhabdobacter roseus]